MHCKIFLAAQKLRVGTHALGVASLLTAGCGVGGLLSLLGTTYLLFAIAATSLAILIVLGQFELLAIIILGIRIVQDYYQVLPLPVYFPFISLLLATGLIGWIFLTQSRERPWTVLRSLGVWALFLVFALQGIPRGVGWNDPLAYYLNVLCSAFVFWMLGTQLSRDLDHLRRLLGMVTALGSTVAIHGLVASATGVFLFATPLYEDYLASVSGFHIAGTQIRRLGSFLINPDTCGTFLAVIGLIALGLLLSSESRRSRVLYAFELGLILLALFFTYTTSAWGAFTAGLLAAAVLMGRWQYRVAIPSVMLVFGLALVLVFPTQVGVFVAHSTRSGEITLRIGTWETALRALAANPLIGLGLGSQTYLVRAEQYRVPLQTTTEAHPHNSYLEYAVMGGVPLLLLFLILVATMLRLALSNFRLVSARQRPLLAGGIAAIVAVSADSLGNNGWTVVPLVAVVWLIFGAISSPALHDALS
jgi:O-antigen ligase